MSRRTSQYHTENLIVATLRAWADVLLESGYDVCWYATGEVEQQGVRPKAIDVVTLTTEIPDQPTYLVRRDGLNPGSVPATQELVIPAFGVQIDDPVVVGPALGLGEGLSFRRQTIDLLGFVVDQFQQRALRDLAQGWLTIAGRDPNGPPTGVYLSVQDYDAVPSPVALRPAEVVAGRATKGTLNHEVPAVRYYVAIQFVIEYVE